MVAAALQYEAPKPAPAADYLPVPDAAARLGCHPNHLARVCREDLAPRGLAVLVPPPDGGPARWFVRRDYDPRLAGAELALAYSDPDLAGYTERQREGALARRECVRLLREARRSWPGTVEQWLPRLLDQLAGRFGFPVSRSSLYQWDRVYQRPADLAKLIDARGGDRRGSSDASAWAAFKDLYLHETPAEYPPVLAGDERPGGGERLALVQPEELSRATRLAASRPRCSSATASRRRGASSSSRHRAGPRSWRAGECWIGDHKQLDCWCRLAGRSSGPWLTTWMDWRTRRVVRLGAQRQPEQQRRSSARCGTG
jgi:hypothetical protein